MELATNILGILTALIPLITAVLAIIVKNKKSENSGRSQYTNVTAKNNSNVINNSSNSTILHTTINNNQTLASTMPKKRKLLTCFFLFLFLAGATMVSALYAQFEAEIYLVIIIECLVLGILSIIATLKHSIGIHETILSTFAILEGIFISKIFKHFFWVKFVGAKFVEQTKFEDLTQRAEYIFENRAYLYYNYFEFLAVAISIMVITWLISTIEKTLSIRQIKDVSICAYLITLAPFLPFLIVEFIFYTYPAFLVT